MGFEPTVRLHVRLISSQVHSTTLPPLRKGARGPREPNIIRAESGCDNCLAADLFGGMPGRGKRAVELGGEALAAGQVVASDRAT